MIIINENKVIRTLVMSNKANYRYVRVHVEKIYQTLMMLELLDGQNSAKLDQTLIFLSWIGIMIDWEDYHKYKALMAKKLEDINNNGMQNKGNNHIGSEVEKEQ